MIDLDDEPIGGPVDEPAPAPADEAGGEAAAPASPPDPLQRLQTRLLPPIALAVVTLLGVGGSFAWASFGLGQAGTEAQTLSQRALRIEGEREWALAEYAPKPARGHTAKLGQVLVNASDSARIRYIKAGVVLAVQRPEQVETVGAFRAHALAATVDVLGARTIDEYTAPGGKDAARRAVRERLETVFPEEMLLGVYFDTFIVE